MRILLLPTKMKGDALKHYTIITVMDTQIPYGALHKFDFCFYLLGYVLL